MPVYVVDLYGNHYANTTVVADDIEEAFRIAEEKANSGEADQYWDTFYEARHCEKLI